MKQLFCEMCDGTSWTKQDGFFICQGCGMKYSVEEAKKMMVDVEEKGGGGTTVLAPQTAIQQKNSIMPTDLNFVEKCLTNARRAKQKEDWEEMEKYYNLAEQNDPNSVEAIFYSAYARAKMSLLEDNIFKRQQAFKVLINCLSFIKDDFDIDDENAIKNLQNIGDDIAALVKSDYVYTKGTNIYGGTISSNKMETLQIYKDLEDSFCVTLVSISEKLPNDPILPKRICLRMAIMHSTSENQIERYRTKLMAIDPEYKAAVEKVKKEEAEKLAREREKEEAERKEKERKFKEEQERRNKIAEKPKNKKCSVCAIAFSVVTLLFVFIGFINVLSNSIIELHYFLIGVSFAFSCASFVLSLISNKSRASLKIPAIALLFNVVNGVLLLVSTIVFANVEPDYYGEVDNFWIFTLIGMIFAIVTSICIGLARKERVDS